MIAIRAISMLTKNEIHDLDANILRKDASTEQIELAISIEQLQKLYSDIDHFDLDDSEKGDTLFEICFIYQPSPDSMLLALNDLIDHYQKNKYYLEEIQVRFLQIAILLQALALKGKVSKSLFFNVIVLDLQNVCEVVSESKYQLPHRNRIPATPPREKISATPPRNRISAAPPRNRISTTPPRNRISTTPPRERILTTPPRERIPNTPTEFDN
jgi:hypothetical protein